MNIEIALFDAFLAGTYSINMALHKSQRTKTLNSGLIEVYNVVFLFSFVNNIGNIQQFLFYHEAHEGHEEILMIRMEYFETW